MKSIHAFLIAALLIAPSFVPGARAVMTQKVTRDTFDAFSGGNFENISLTSDGHLELAPAITNLANVTDPIIWAAVQDKKGNIYLGTGNEGKVYKLTPKGELSTFFEPNAVMVHALAIDGDGRLYAATSPNGCIYRLDSDGRAEVFCNPGEPYVWAMVFGGDGFLYLATGDHGKILRVRASDSLPAKAETYFETREANITTLALDKDGSLLGGSSPHGYLYRIDKTGHGFVLFNSGDKEIKQIGVAPDGVIYASTFVSNPKPGGSSEEGPVTISISPGEGSSGMAVGGGKSHSEKIPIPNIQSSEADNNDEGDAIVTIGEASSAQISTDEGGGDGGKSFGAIYRIETNGFAEHYWSVSGEAVYSMILLPDGTLMAGTGEKGRIYEISDANHWKLLQETSDGAQVAALFTDNHHADQVFVATSNPGNIYRLDLSLAVSGVYTSTAFDAKENSQWGRLHPLGDVPGGTKLELMTRSGNTPKPQKTWSDWSSPQPLSAEIAVTSPNARYLQYRVTFKRDAGSPGATARLRRMEFYYQNLNAPPVISRIRVHNEGFSVVKMPVPDMGGPQANINELLDGGSKPSGAAEMILAMMAQPPLRATPRPGYCTVVWEAKDPNDDKLTYSVFIRAESDSHWSTLVDKTEDTFYSFDTTGFHEGDYFIKVTASDRLSNTPETALGAEAISEPFLIDNSPPALTVQSQTIKRGHGRIVVNAVDPASVIVSAAYSLDGKDEVALRPENLIFDSMNQTFAIELNGLGKGRHSLLVRTEDEAKNAAVLQLSFEVK
ncbi:MAG TPA: WD40 repeat domain-containing protein [Verrucomicrobiae bacterium]